MTGLTILLTTGVYLDLFVLGVRQDLLVIRRASWLAVDGRDKKTGNSAFTTPVVVAAYRMNWRTARSVIQIAPAPIKT